MKQVTSKCLITVYELDNWISLLECVVKPYVKLIKLPCIIVSVLALSKIGCGFESKSVQTKDYKIGICSFSTKHAVLRSKSKDWLACNQVNVSSLHVYPQTVDSVN